MDRDHHILTIKRGVRTMNLIDAVKSGKSFKRPEWRHFYSAPAQLLFTVEDIRLQLTIEDILADDWEVEEKQITITESDFNKAVVKTGNLYYQDQGYWADALKKELGL